MKRGDWARLWGELAGTDLMTGPRGEEKMVERWQRLATRLDSDRGDPDPLLDSVLEWVEPHMTVLDIGAGVGRWTLPLARKAAAVTALEPVAAMREVLNRRLAAGGVENVRVVEASWLEAEVGPHDIAVSVHSTYTSPDLISFVRRMEERAKRCCVVLRVPAWDGVLGELAEILRGRWHDSPNFVVGLNALLEAGIYPNVLMEPGASRTWRDSSLTEAVQRARRHLHLADESFDETIREVLSRRLIDEPGGLRWPDGMRSALCWWDVDRR